MLPQYVSILYLILRVPLSKMDKVRHDHSLIMLNNTCCEGKLSRGKSDTSYISGLKSPVLYAVRPHYHRLPVPKSITSGNNFRRLQGHIGKVWRSALVNGFIPLTIDYCSDNYINAAFLPTITAS